MTSAVTIGILLGCVAGTMMAQAPLAPLPDFSKAAPVRSIIKPYQWRPIQGPDSSPIAGMPL